VLHYNNETSSFETFSSSTTEFITFKPGESYYLYCLKDLSWAPVTANPTTSFVYDGDGGRVKKTVGSNSTTYIGSLFEKDSDGTLRKHIFAGSNRIASMEQGLSPQGTEVHYIHPDHLGSSNVVTDSTGKQEGFSEFTPYGSTFRQTGTYDPKHKFTGKELDESGLYFYGARYYDPEIGRFITADTIVQTPYDPQSLNRYAYCRNNPINYVDPTGHFWGAIFAFLGFIAKAAAVVSIVSAVAGGINLATGNQSAASVCFQVSQISGYVSIAASVASFIGNSMRAAAASRLTQLASASSGVTLDTIVVTQAEAQAYRNAAVAVEAAALAKDSVRAGIAGAISAMGSTITQAASFIIEPAVNTLTRPGWNYGSYLSDIDAGHISAKNFYGACLDSAWAVTNVYGTIEAVAANGAPYWQYYPAGNPEYTSPYLTRGWNPPHEPGQQAYRALRLDLAKRPNPGTAVKQVNVNWWERVGGGRTVKGGTGTEFYRGRFTFPED
jgi:RHS repeat-associated protein